MQKFALILSLLFLFAPGLLHAQASEEVLSTAPSSFESESESAEEPPPDPGTPRFFGPEHRRELYEANRLHSPRAILYNLALPGLGNFYAEQYAIGVIALSTLAFGAVFIAFGFTNQQPAVIHTGIGIAAISYLGSSAFSVYGVRAYNENLRRSLHIDSATLPAPTTLQLTWHF